MVLGAEVVVVRDGELADDLPGGDEIVGASGDDVAAVGVLDDIDDGVTCARVRMARRAAVTARMLAICSLERWSPKATRTARTAWTRPATRAGCG